jgi:tetratricopeptide (TPR) repeat protein
MRGKHNNRLAILAISPLAFSFCLISPASCTAAGTDSAQETTLGVKAYNDEHLVEALGHFVKVLSQDPSNEQAHSYMNLLIQKLDASQLQKVQNEREAILTSASKRLAANRMDSWAIDQAMLDNTKTEKQDKRERWHKQCIMAQMEDRLGHLEAANDLILQVIADDPNDTEAQRILSDLESQLHEALDTVETLPAYERAALEGFYAYDQADYRLAHTAWSKARSSIDQSFAANDAARETTALHFDAYDKVAQAHVDDEDRVAKEQSIFSQGLDLFQKGSYAQALEHFRQVALMNPDYPQLAMYLVQSEAAVEKDRTRRLSQEKRDRAGEAFTIGLAALEKGRYPEAKKAFEDVLSQDPSHPQARSYLSVVETEMNRRHDPKAAQQHYDAGLIAYASGKLEEAIREWSIAAKLNPEDQKAAKAISKVQKEIVTFREVPG